MNCMMAPYVAWSYNTITLCGTKVLVVSCSGKQCSKAGAGFTAHEPCMAPTDEFEFVYSECLSQTKVHKVCVSISAPEASFVLI